MHYMQSAYALRILKRGRNKYNIHKMAEQKELILSLGSNYDQEKNIADAKSELLKTFGQTLMFSECKWTEPIGIKSDRFLNCLAFAHTSFSIDYINRALKHIESTCGNTRQARSRDIVKMDIDILKYGNVILHEDDWKRNYIIELMKVCPF